MTLDRAQLEKFLTGVTQVRALVVGDLMLDEYIWGAVDRISPEAPVQIVEVKRVSNHGFSVVRFQTGGDYMILNDRLETVERKEVQH